MAELDILADLITEGKKDKRATLIKKAAEKTIAAKDKTPLEAGPPIRRDVYQQLEWRALSVILITHTTVCKCCGSAYEAPNPSIFVERYHRRHGRHLVEAHNFSLLPREVIEALPRKIETHTTEALYCQQCFLTNQEPLCLEQPMLPLTLESSQLSALPCVPQEWATPSLLRPWFTTFDPTQQSMNNSSRRLELSKPESSARFW
jgi:hypothetical protein